MFVALGLSLIFTLIYATAAARLRRAEKVLIPLLDILQSVPILGSCRLRSRDSSRCSLVQNSVWSARRSSRYSRPRRGTWRFRSITRSLLQPRELDEASRLLRLSRWQRFWRLDLPSGMIPLVWNGMMSFGGGRFFLTASEALSVNNHHFALPGIEARDVEAAAAHFDEQCRRRLQRGVAGQAVTDGEVRQAAPSEPSMTSSLIPVLTRMRSRKASALAASRTALVATARTRVTP